MAGFRLQAALVSLALVLVAPASAALHQPSKKRRVVHRSNAAEVVVPRGQSIHIAFANDAGVGFSASLANAVQMAVDAHPTIRGFPVAIDAVNVPTCGNPSNAGSVASSAATAITANRRNVAVLGQVCSFGFAQALPIYEDAGVVTLTGSATYHSLPTYAPTVFDRTVVADEDFDAWYATVSALPSDVAWRQAYAAKYGSEPSEFADLYYDAASLLLDDINRVSSIGWGSYLVINRNDLANTVRATTDYRGVSCTVSIDASTGNRIDDSAALAGCG